MTEQNPPPRPPAPRRASRRSAPQSPRSNPYRLVIRLVGLPLVAVAGVFLYRGLQSHFELPACDSDTAKQTLTEVLKQLKLEPVRYAPIKTVSKTKDEVVCNAVMPLPDGGNVVADYTFYWQGDKANMKYSISRKAAVSSGPTSVQPLPSPSR